MGTARSTLLVPFLAAALLGACGGSAPSVAPGDDPAARTAPRQVGPLTVTGVDARLGDATTVSRRTGVRELTSGPRRVDPSALRRREARDGVAGESTCQNIDAIPSSSNLPAIEAATLCLLNAERAAAGLAPVRLNAKLAQASIAHSQDMVAHGYFAHESRDGRTVADRARAAGYIPSDREWIVGENLAWGTGTLASPQKTMSAWMNSAGHRANVLRGEFDEVGFGVVLGTPSNKDAGATYTSVFGKVSGGDAATAATHSETRSSTRRKWRRTCARRPRAKRSRAARARCARLARRARAARNR